MVENANKKEKLRKTKRAKEEEGKKKVQQGRVRTVDLEKSPPISSNNLNKH